MVIQLYNKHQTYNGQFTVGQDIDGKLYVKCNDCNQTMIGTLNYVKGKRGFKYICPKCEKKTQINL